MTDILNQVKALHNVLDFGKHEIIKDEPKLFTVNYKSFELTYKLEKNIITIESDDLIGLHILRLLNLKNKNEIKEDNLFDVMFQLTDIFNANKDNLFKQCTICGSEIHNNKPALCLSDNCLNKSYQIVTDNTLTDLYKSDKQVFIFILQTAIAGLFHPKCEDVYKPLPIMDKIKTVKEITSVIPEKYKNNDLSELINFMCKYPKEQEVYNFLQQPFYSFLKNAILSNKTSLVTNKDKSDTGTIHFDIKYDPETEYNFSEVPYYLFHGSNVCSWYAILRNGIKNMSNTKFMAHGAAYGPGVYMSDNYNVSYGYSSANQHFNYNVTGVVQVLDAKNVAVQKATGIFVATDDTKLLLRSIIIRTTGTHKRTKITAATDISSYYTKDKLKEQLDNLQLLGHLSGKRLAKELNLIGKEKSENIIFVDQTTINRFVAWKFTLTNFLNEKINGCELIIIFPNKYPVDSPFVYLNKYPDSTDDYFVLKNGLIMLDFLSPKEWNILTTIQKITKHIWDTFNEIYSNDKLNKKNIKLVENICELDELRNAYSTMIKKLNWI